MRLPLWFRLQGRVDDRIPTGLVVMRFASTARCNFPYLPDPQVTRPLAPKVHRGTTDIETVCNGLVLLPIDSTQENTATQRNLLGSAMGGFPLFELRVILGTHRNRETNF